MNTRRVAPGTRLREVATALLDATSRLQRGVTLAEIRAAYEERYPRLDPRAFPRALAKLEAAGEALKIGGRHRRTQWRHVTLPVQFVDPEDIAPVILETVQRLCSAHHRAIEAGEVAKNLRQQGHAVTADQVRNRLESLAHSSARKSEQTVAEWSKPRVQRISQTTAGGSQRVYWAPIGSDLRPPHFADGRNAIRYAVSRAMEDVGRPITRREVILWAKVQLLDSDGDQRDVEAAQVVNSGRFRQLLANALTWDEARELEDGRLRSVRTALSSRGAYPVRFCTRAPTADGLGACIAEDIAMLLRPHSELESIALLREEAREIGSAVMLEIADERDRALAAALRRLAPACSGDNGWLSAACEVAESSRSVVAGWAREVAPRRLGDWTENSEISGLLEIAGERRKGGIESDGLLTIDQTDGVAMQEFEPLAREALALADRDVLHWSPLIVSARRIRGPITGGNSCQDPSDTQSFLDRADTLHALVDAGHLPALSALVGSALSLLGNVLRDAKPLLRWLSDLGPGETMLRQSIVVALGLLGTRPHLEQAWPDPSDSEQAAAYYACLALGVDDEAERAGLALAADRRARGAAMDISEMAALELGGGGRLGVVG